MACLPDAAYDMHIMEDLFDLDIEGPGMHGGLGSPKLQDSNAVALTSHGAHAQQGTPGVTGGMVGKLGPAHHTRYHSQHQQHRHPGGFGEQQGMLDAGYNMPAAELLDGAFDAAYELGLADDDMGLPFPDHHMGLAPMHPGGPQGAHAGPPGTLPNGAPHPDLSNVLPPMPSRPSSRQQQFPLPNNDPHFDPLDATFEVDLHDELLGMGGDFGPPGAQPGALLGPPPGQPEDMGGMHSNQKQRTLRSGKGLGARRMSVAQEMFPPTGPMQGPLGGPLGPPVDLPQHHSLPVMSTRAPKGLGLDSALPSGGDIRLSVHAGPVTSIPQPTLGISPRHLMSRGPADAAGKRKAGASLTSSRMSMGNANDDMDEDDEHLGPGMDPRGHEPTAKRKKKSQNEKIAELQKQVESLRDQNMTLKKKAGKLASDKTKIIDCLSHLTQLVNQKKNENERLRTKINTLQAAVCDTDSLPQMLMPPQGSLVAPGDPLGSSMGMAQVASTPHAAGPSQGPFADPTGAPAGAIIMGHNQGFVASPGMQQVGMMQQQIMLNASPDAQAGSAMMKTSPNTTLGPIQMQPWMPQGSPQEGAPHTVPYGGPQTVPYRSPQDGVTQTVPYGSPQEGAPQTVPYGSPQQNVQQLQSQQSMGAQHMVSAFFMQQGAQMMPTGPEEGTGVPQGPEQPPPGASAWAQAGQEANESLPSDSSLECPNLM